MKGHNFQHQVIVGSAIPAQSIGQAATVNGNAIAEPWRDGRQISFLWVGGALGAASTATVTVQGLKRSDGTTWEALKDKAGNNLVFTASKFADTGQLENGVVLGTIPLCELASNTYGSIRVIYVRGNEAVTQLVGCAYIISDLYQHPSGTVDDLFDKVFGV